jgi:hypothetical protein
MFSVFNFVLEGRIYALNHAGFAEPWAFVKIASVLTL